MSVMGQGTGLCSLCTQQGSSRGWEGAASMPPQKAAQRWGKLCLV